MMKAAVGSSWAVTGRSSATVSAGPMPGRTPIAVPTVTPSADQNRFIGVSATPKPWPSAASVSMVRAFLFSFFVGGGQKSFDGRTDGQGQAQPVVEDQEGEAGERQADQHGDDVATLRKGKRSRYEQERGRDDPAQAFDQEHLQQQPSRHQGHGPPIELEATLVRDVAEECLPEHANPDSEEAEGNQGREQARPDGGVGRGYLQQRDLDPNEQAQPQDHAAQHSLANSQADAGGNRRILPLYRISFKSARDPAGFLRSGRAPVRERTQSRPPAGTYRPSPVLSGGPATARYAPSRPGPRPGPACPPAAASPAPSAHAS